MVAKLLCKLLCSINPPASVSRIARIAFLYNRGILIFFLYYWLSNKLIFYAIIFIFKDSYIPLPTPHASYGSSLRGHIVSVGHLANVSAIEGGEVSFGSQYSAHHGHLFHQEPQPVKAAADLKQCCKLGTEHSE